MFGDSLLAAGQARIIHEITGQKVRIGNPDSGNIKWFELYEYIPYLTKMNEGIWLKDHPGYRGYIKKFHKLPDGRVLKADYNLDYRAEPAYIEIDEEPNDYIIIEPSKKNTAAPGKLWHGYQEVVDAFGDKFLQFNQSTLKGVDRRDTTLTEAARIMKGCRCYIGTEGFLHHLAAAFGKPAVVLMGSFTPAPVMSYPGHINLAVDNPEEVGHAVYGSMANIPLDAVIEALSDALSGRIASDTLIRKRGDYIIRGVDIRYF